MNKNRKLQMYNNQKCEERKMRSLENLEIKSHISSSVAHHSGITLVALVVTIVVLLILAGVTITALLGDDGIIKNAQNAADLMNNAIQSEQNEMNALINELNGILIGDGGGTTPGGGNEEVNPPEPEEPERPLLGTIKEIQYNENIEAKDSYGNIVWVPKGFKVVEGSAGEEITVPNGVVIEDSAGNQFVWIPVGTVYKNEERTDKSIIKLGRYTWDEDGTTPIIQQAAFAGDNPSDTSQTYNDTVTIPLRFQELTISRPGVASSGTDALNATAKDLAGFVQSVSEHGGYYIARYEASYGSGSSISDWKPLSQPSTANSTSSMNYTPGTLWNFINQPNAAQVARNMYAENKDIEGNGVGVESDLINSYAWDTAIVYIQEMGHNNYIDYSRDETGNSSLMNTGETGDVVCNIYDMAANTLEWTTEYSTYVDSNYALPYISRGGYYSYRKTCSKSSVSINIEMSKNVEI